MTTTTSRDAGRSATKKNVAGPAATQVTAGGRPAGLKQGAASHSRLQGVEAPSFAGIVASEPMTGLEAINLIRAGYPAAIMKEASSYFTVPDARIQKIVQVPASTASRLEKKQARIDPAATERIFRMGTVTRMAISVFEQEAAAIAWMRQPNRALGDTSPLDLMDTEPGAVSVRLILNAIATGGAA